MPDLIDRLARLLGDRYRIERELGHGGMGIVLLAHDLKHDRLVAPNRQLALLDPNKGAEEQRPEIISRSTFGDFLVNSWSQNGEVLAGQVGNVGGMATGILVYSFKTRRYEKITEVGEWPVWLPDNRRILVVANKNAFYIVDTRTKQVRKIFSVERDVIGPPRLTRDGRSAYFIRRVNEADIWLLTMRPTR